MTPHTTPERRVLAPVQTARRLRGKRAMKKAIASTRITWMGAIASLSIAQPAIQMKHIIKAKTRKSAFQPEGRVDLYVFGGGGYRVRTQVAASSSPRLVTPASLWA